MKSNRTCIFCKNIFLVENKEINRGYGKYCSRSCSMRHKKPEKKLLVSCSMCLKYFKRKPSGILGNTFCSLSCSAKYNNTHKTKGTRISKLEVWLQTQLTEKFPNLEFHFNRKDAINSELDIFIPSLKLAFELNGIFHYEPIYGIDKLDEIQNNDNRKFQACLEQGIELCIIDTSHLKYFKESEAIKYFDIINQTIGKVLARNFLLPL